MVIFKIQISPYQLFSVFFVQHCPSLSWLPSHTIMGHTKDVCVQNILPLKLFDVASVLSPFPGTYNVLCHVLRTHHSHVCDNNIGYKNFLVWPSSFWLGVCQLFYQLPLILQMVVFCLFLYCISAPTITTSTTTLVSVVSSSILPNIFS